MSISRYLLLLLFLSAVLPGPAAPRHVPTILLTGFEPFGRYARNSSWEAIKDLDGKEIRGHLIRTVQLPVEYVASAEVLSHKIREVSPEVVIGFGVVEGMYIKLERSARNFTGRLRDLKGYLPEERVIEPDLPDKLTSTLPLAYIDDYLRANDVKSYVSRDAGDYLCNYISYKLLARQRGEGIQASGFVHLPPLDSTYTAEYLNRIVVMIVESTLSKL